ERPAAAQFAAVEKDGQLAVFDALAHQCFRALAVEAWLAVVLRRVNAGVPDDDLAAAVLAFGDYPFEAGVVQRVVLGHNRQASLAVLVGRSVRDGPRLEHAVDYEAEVVVQASRCELLDHESQQSSVRL